MFKKLILTLSVLSFAQVPVSADESTGYLNAIRNSKMFVQAGQTWNDFSTGASEWKSYAFKKGGEIVSGVSTTTSKTASRCWKGTVGYAKDLKNIVGKHTWQDQKMVQGAKIAGTGIFALVGSGLLLKSFKDLFGSVKSKRQKINGLLSGITGLGCLLTAYNLGLDCKLIAK